MIFKVRVIDKGRVIKSGTVDADNESLAIEEVNEAVSDLIWVWVEIKEIKC